MLYGYFDHQQREYVIERPDTPWPWINYLGDDEYCAIISNNAGGYSFYRSAGENRLLRYRFNAVPCDRPGRYLYLRDAETGEFWTNSWSPTQKPLSEHLTRCRHGQGYTRMESRYRDIASEVLYFVPVDDPVEIWQCTITNSGARPRTLDLFSYCEFGFPYVTSEIALQAILYVAKTYLHDGIIGYETPIPGWRTRAAYFACSAPATGYDCLRESFIGPWRGEDRPLAVEQGRCCSSAGAGGNAVGCLQLVRRLQPGESTQFTFFLGEGAAAERGVAVRERYTPERLAESFAELQRYWEGRLSRQQVRTPDEATNVMLNVWHPYQVHVTYHWSRAATLIEAGLRDGLGYRDTAQDILGALYSVGAAAKTRIFDLLRGQERRGCALHKVQPLTLKVGAGETVPEGEIWSDDHLWLPLTVGAYLRETGDLIVLDSVVPYLDAGEGSVYEHLWRALDFAYAHRGAHGLLLCLAADWNDALQLGPDGQSVWVSMQFCLACAEVAEMARLRNQPADAERALAWREEMCAAINRSAWDGQWYLCGVLGDGRTIGSQVDEVAKIWLNMQTWSVIAGVADTERALQAMDAVHDHLASRYGLHLFAPPHQGYAEDVPGRVCYPPGLKENAAIFCHPNPWAIIAETMLGRGERAFEYYTALLPSARNDDADHRRVEPYAYCQFITGQWDAAFGTGHNPWLTGTASWMYVAAMQYILGVRPSLHGLIIDPCLPAAWDEVTVTRLFRDATYHITIRNPHHHSGGVARLLLNGQACAGNVVPIAGAGETVEVEAVL